MPKLKGRNHDRPWHYAQYRSYSSKLDGVSLDSVTCPECDYAPGQFTTDPVRAFKAHIKKHHRALYYREYAKPYVIKEESDLVDLRTYV